MAERDPHVVIRRIAAGPDQPELALRDLGGAGEPLVCLHGVARSGEDFAAFAQGMGDSARVFALDFRGHGESGRMPGRYTVRDYANDARRALGSVLEQPWIFGHSLGALCALAVVAESGIPVHGIVLEDPPFHSMGEEITGTRWHAQFIGMRDVARAGGTLESMTSQLAAVRVPALDGDGTTTLGNLRSRESLEFSASCLAKIDAEVFTPIIEGRWLEGYDYLALLARVQSPVLLLQGDPSAGGALSDEYAGLAAGKARNCRLVKFHDAGHQIRAARPEEVRRLVREFISI